MAKVSHGYAAINDIALFAPGVTNWMSASQQNDLAIYLANSVSASPIVTYGYSTQNNLVEWMNSRMSDGKSDVLVIMDLAPERVYNGGDDGSLAEQWIENGNLNSPSALRVSSNWIQRK